MNKRIKIAIAQLNFHVGNFKHNVTKIKDTIANNQADIVLFSEMSLSGYIPMDLIYNESFWVEHDKSLNEIVDFTKGKDFLVVLGIVRKNLDVGKPYYNSLVVIKDGLVIEGYDKQLLPTYNIFDEYRYFESGNKSLVLNYKEINIGFLICEDAWNDSGDLYSNNPFDGLKDKVDIILTLNASPSDVDKSVLRHNIYNQVAEKYDVAIVYANQVGVLDQNVFDGGSFVAIPNGDILVMKSFEEDINIVDLQYGAEKLESYRFVKNGGVIKNIDEINTDIPNKYDFYIKQLSYGLQDYMAKTGFKTIVVGSSGGIDSALTLALAKIAIGAENVFAITMPTHFSSLSSVSDSEKLVNNMGVKLFNYNIGQETKDAFKKFEDVFGVAPNNITKENIQARIRGRVLMEYSNNFGSLLLSTGNKSEIAVGYATLYGDMNGGINMIGDLYKTEVFELSKYINEKYGEMIPVDIINKEPSAELSENQKDSDSLPPYEILDCILKMNIDGLDNLLYEEAEKVELFYQNIEKSDKIRVLKLIEKSEFKRKQSAPIIRVRRVAFGLGRQVPITAVQQYN